MTFLKYSISVIASLGLMTSAAMAADLDPISPASDAVQNDVNNDSFYVSLFGGANLAVGDPDFSNGTNTVATDLNTGFLFGGAVGYKWKDFGFNGITPRTELELNYFRNGVDSLDFSGNGVGDEALVGENVLSGFGGFANVFLDFDNVFDSGLTPYVGGGIGFASVDTNLLYGPGANINDRDTTFAFNVGGGAKFDIAESTSLFVDARYTQFVDVEGTRLTGTGAPNPGPGATDTSFEDDFSSVQIRAGISFGF